MPLSLDDINGVLARYAPDMEEAELQGIREMLLMRAAKPDAATKLKMALDQLPAEQLNAANDAVVAMGAVGASVLARGRRELEAIPDDEWDRLIEEGLEEEKA